jgi:hypothetical protein
MVNIYFSAVRLLAPGRLPPIELAPFGVNWYDVSIGLDVIADRIRKYTPVS